VFKKIILALATFAVISIVYAIYQWQDDTPGPGDQPRSAAVPRRTLPPRPRTTRPADAAEVKSKSFSWGEAKIPPGDAPRVRVYDRKGNAKIVFQATRWHPVSDNEFHMAEPGARLLLPGGQLAYVRADEGQVVVQRGDNNNLNPKRGWFRGHVQIFVDLTKPDWRKENPELAEPQQHPEAVVKIWLEDVDFDLDLTCLHSDGPILLQSRQGTIAGRGLTLVWNEVDRRIRQLRIAEGRRATLRDVKLASFTVPAGAQPTEQAGDGKGEVVGDQAAAPAVAASGSEAVDAKEGHRPERREGLSLIDPDDEYDQPREDRIDTYRIVFRENVVAERKEGIKVAGRLKADILELLGDFGPQERELLGQAPSTQPAGNGKDGSPAQTVTAAADAKGRSTIEVRWTGPLEVLPVQDAREGRAAIRPAGNRTHVLARGSPVELYDRQEGTATCRELEYHDEAKKVWLRGSAAEPVTLRSAPNQQLMGETIFIDQEAGIARVGGPGRLIDHPEGLGAGALHEGPTARAEPAWGEHTDRVEVTWSRSVQIEFGMRASDSPAPARTSPIPTGVHLKHAEFDGEVVSVRAGQSIAADHFEVTFMEPPSKTEAPDGTKLTADRIIATGNVRMRQETKEATEHVSCDRLEVEMTIDDTGANVPKAARAVGRVVARQVARADRPVIRGGDRRAREIRADDELIVSLVSVPKVISEGQRAGYEAAARRANIEPGSPEWQDFEAKLRDRREIAVSRMVARGNVAARDPDAKLNDLGADLLECTFGEDQRIARALVVRQGGQPAYVDHGDFYIRGRQISLDMNSESVEVPGEGLLRFFTKQDLDGRPVDEPIPIVVTWAERMSLRGRENAGTFTGSVHTVSETTALDCRQLRLRFENLPKPPAGSATQPARRDTRWIVGPILDSVLDDRASPGARSVAKRMRKRLAYLHAVGDAVIKSKAYAAPTPGPVARLLRDVLPAALEPSGSQPAADGPRLVSRVRVAGPQIAIDLRDEYLVVEGAGNLQIEDYRSPETSRRARSEGSDILGRASVASLDGLGPSQTLFTWQNSMSFLNNRNVAVFDHSVEMIHRAGSQMVLSGELAEAMQVDPRILREFGREAGLSCDNLLVGFDRGVAGEESGPWPLSGATQLKHFRAAGRVRLEERVPHKTKGRAPAGKPDPLLVRWVAGTLVTYNDETGTGRVFGSAQFPPRFCERDERTGRFFSSSVDAFEWNQKTRRIRIAGSRMLATGK